MAFLTLADDPKVRHEGPVGGGLRGHRKTFHVYLAAATPRVVYFEGYKLKDPDNVNLSFAATHTNGAGEACGGTPSTTPIISADGTNITLQNSAIMRCSFSIEGEWERI